MKITQRKYVKQMIFLCSAVYFASYLTRVNFQAVISEIVRAEGYSKALISLAVTGSSITYGVGQLLSGYLGDKLAPEKIILAGMLSSFLLNIAIPVMPNAWSIIAVWSINGLAQAFMWPPLVRILSELFTDSVYKDACVKVSWGSSFGTIAVYLIAPVCISLTGWRSMFIFSAVFCVIIAVIWLTARKRILSASVGTVSEDDGSEITACPSCSQCSTEISRRKPTVSEALMIMLILISIIAMGFLRDGIITWMPSYVAETFHLENAIAILGGVVLPLFGVACFQLAAVINRKYIKNELLCAAVIFSFGLLSLILLYIFSDKNAVISVFLSAFATGCMHGVNVIIICMTPPFFGKFGKISLASGVLNSCTYIGSALSTYSSALVSESFGWNSVILMWALVAVAGTAAAFLSVRKWNSFKHS